MCEAIAYFLLATAAAWAAGFGFATLDLLLDMPGRRRKAHLDALEAEARRLDEEDIRAELYGRQ